MTKTSYRRAIAACLLSAATCALTHPAFAQEKPNIVMIVVDDMGFSDMSSFGGEIPTPNIDALVDSGVQLTNFHVAPTCSPTRSMLFSGTDNHVAGLGSMAEEILDEQRGNPGYEGFLNDRVWSFPQLLQENGYYTVMSGKWHLGNKEGLLPNARGFDRSLAMLNGGAHHFDQTGMIRALPKALYTRDDQPIELGSDFTYSTEYFTTELISQIEATPEGKPFFGYLAYTAPHWPLQAPRESIDLFKGKYDVGYQAIREGRMQRMKERGLLPTEVEANTSPDLWPHWDELSEQQRKEEARRMEVYAAMIHEVDKNIGRLVSHLKSTGAYDNTMFIFFSDNGAEGGLPEEIIGGRNREYVETAFDNSYDNLGNKGSYIGYGRAWAMISQTPFRMVKGYTYEGGIRAPAFISYPGARDKVILDQFVHVMDIAPTLIDVAGGTIPQEHNGQSKAPMIGHSILPWLKDERNEVRPQDEAVCTELFGRYSVWRNGWKLVHSNSPWGTGSPELYHLAEDPTEMRDLSASQPERLAAMLADWDSCQTRFGIYWNEGLAPQMVYSNDLQYLFRPERVNKQ